MAESLLGPKLEVALIAWINATKGARLSGLAIQPAHGKAEPAPPYLSVWCARSPVHPDFAGVPGMNLPRRCVVEFFLKGKSKDVTFADTVGKWSGELSLILSRRSVVVPAASVDAGANTFTSADHYLSDGLTVRLTSSVGLPAPLVAGTDYFVRDAANNTFKLAATVGGVAIDLSTVGTGDHTVAVVGDFSALIAAVNEGGRLHPSEGLLVEGIAVIEDGTGVLEDKWLASIQVEIDAQNFDDAS